jgi:putative RecB family exonuclease
MAFMCFMTVYSHSRLSCYEQCPQKFKLQYIDKVETEEEETVEAFLGIHVHEALEKLYRDLEYQKMNSLKDLLGFFHEEWKKNWSDGIVIIKNEYTPENYVRMGEKYISDYYARYHPFNQGKTIALEQRILINLNEAGEYKLQGYIDRLTEAKDGFYEIHDYKTNSRLPLADYIRTDRQLALYMIGVKKQYPDVKHVRLIWHFLKFDKEIDSTRTNEELEKLKADTIKLIETIEQDETFETSPSLLCDWCEFKPLCRQWAHLHKIREKSENEYLKDSGVNLVNKYAEIKSKQKQMNDELDAEIVKLEEAIIAFAEKEQIDMVFGSQNKVRVTNYERYVCPEKDSRERVQLEKLLKDQGKWLEVSQLNISALNKIIRWRQWDATVLDTIKEYVELEKSKRLYLSKKTEK